MQILKDEFEAKKEKFEKTKKELKEFFVGLDDIIDKVFSSIEVWYYMPYLLERPIIINLWGMTGTGKTDLVRKIVQGLEFRESYFEIQLEKEGSGYHRLIQDEIHYSGISSKSPGILLLDEIQRFRTINEKGEMLVGGSSNFNDIWMLLSDGRFSDSMREKEDLLGVLLNMKFEQGKEDDENKETVTTKAKKTAKFRSSLYEARSLKRKLELEETIDEIMMWSIDKKIFKIENKLNSLNNENVKIYSQLLIFVCGNLDEAYEMSDNVSEVNIDADILHEFSKKIDILKIKTALTTKFKPEQIARFGNNHIIYPSLSKKSFQMLIEKKLNDIVKRIKNKFDIEISFSKKINHTIYKNGIYPTQGTRPLFSTINNIIENSIPIFAYRAKLLNVKKFDVDIDEENIYTFINGEKFSKKVDLQLESLINEITKENISKTAVHESGHAVVYALLTNIAPSQIVGNSISHSSRGFVVPHEFSGSKTSYIYSLQILLAGIVAEEIVFGEEYKTSGGSADIEQATIKATFMVRRFNMDGSIGRIIPALMDKADFFITDIEQTNQIIENLLKDAKSTAKDLLQKNIKFLKKVIEKVIEVKRLLPEDFVEIAKEFLPNIKIKQNDYTVTENYSEMVERFLK